MDSNIKDPLAIDMPFSEDTMTEYFHSKMNADLEDMKATVWVDFERWESDWNDWKIKKSNNRNNISSPVSSTAVNSTTPRLVNDLFGYAYPVSVTGDNTPLGKQLESEGRKFFAYHLESNLELNRQMWHGISNSCGIGVAYEYTCWKEEKEYYTREEVINLLIVNGQPALDPNNQPIQPTPEIIQKLQSQQINFQILPKKIQVQDWRYKKYGAETKCLDEKHVVYSSDAISLQDAFETDYVGIRVFKTLDQILGAINSEDKDLLYSKINAIKAKEFATDKSKSEAKDFINSRSKKIEFWLIFGRYPIDGKKESQISLLLHPGTKTLLGYQEFEYDHNRCPVVALNIFERHDRIIGKSIPELLYDLKTYLDKSRNQRLDLRDQHLDPVVVHSTKSGYDKASMKFGMGQSWELDDINELRIEKIDSFDNGQYRDEEMILADINKITGLADIAYGMEPSTDQTFRGLQQILKEGSESRGMYKKWLSIGIREIFYQIYRLYQQYIFKKQNDPKVQEFVQNILDNGNKFITPQTIQALNHSWNIIIKATNDDKQLRLLKAKEKHDFLVDDPNVQASPEHFRKLKVDVLSAIDDQDPEGSYPTTQQLEQLQQQRVTIAMKEIEAEKAKVAEQQRIEGIQNEEFNKELGRQEVKQELAEVAGVKTITNKTGELKWLLREKI